MHHMHRGRNPLSIYTPTHALFYPVQKLQSGAIRYQSGLAGCTGLNACLHNESFGRHSSAPVNQVWEPIAPDWPSYTGLIPLGAKVYTQSPINPGGATLCKAPRERAREKAHYPATQKREPPATRDP
jgi:hypothetical protein